MNLNPAIHHIRRTTKQYVAVVFAVIGMLSFLFSDLPAFGEQREQQLPVVVSKIVIPLFDGAVSAGQ